MSDALAAGIAGAASAGEVARIRSLEERAGEYARASRAENTLRAYRSDLRDFEQWYTDHRRRSLPATPDTLTLYLTAIQRRVSAISQAHQLAGPLADPRLDGARDAARDPPHPGHRARAEGAHRRRRAAQPPRHHPHRHARGPARPRPARALMTLAEIP
jgi:hypothetical protein